MGKHTNNGKKPDRTADEDGDLNVLIANLVVSGQAVNYQVNGNDDDANVVVTFTDADGSIVTALHHFNGSYRADLSTLDYGPIVASIVATDDVGNVALGQGDSFMLVPF